MIVAVSMRVVEAQGYLEPRDALSHDLVAFLESLGCVPLLIPNTRDPKPYLERFKFDRLVLSGGEDIVSNVAGPPEAIVDTRDLTERHLLDAALDAGKPVLGICRGAMFLNLRFGGGLTTNLKDAIGENHVAQPHQIELRDRRRATTNSFHNHGILSSQLAPGMELLAKTAGGSVEAFSRAAPRLLGIMWHPERTGSALDVDREMLTEWLK